MKSRLAPLSGVVFSLLVVAAFALDRNTEFMPPASDIGAYYGDGPLRIMIAAYLVLLAAVALAWFAGCLHASLRDSAEERLATLAYGGGILAAALFIMSGVATIAAAERVRISGEVSTASAVALFDIAQVAVGNGAVLGLGLLVGATGLAWSRQRHLPRWQGGLSVLLALALLSPAGWAALVAALLWVPAVGIGLARAKAARVFVEAR